MTLKVGCIHHTRIFVLFCAFALLPQLVQDTRNTVTTTITVGNEPDSVAFAPNGVHAYITHYTNGSSLSY